MKKNIFKSGTAALCLTMALIATVGVVPSTVQNYGEKGTEKIQKVSGSSWFGMEDPKPIVITK